MVFVEYDVEKLKQYHPNVAFVDMDTIKFYVEIIEKILPKMARTNLYLAGRCFTLQRNKVFKATHDINVFVRSEFESPSEILSQIVTIVSQFGVKYESILANTISFSIQKTLVNVTVIRNCIEIFICWSSNIHGH